MKLFTALSLAAVVSASSNPFAPRKSENNAKATYVRSLLNGAVATAGSQLRRLDQEDYVVDISSYSVKFEKCQFVKAYDDELAQDKDSTTVLATKRFVIFRLCPNNACDACNYNYGEYLIDLDSYLAATVEYFSNYQEGMCRTCEENCQYDDAAAAEDVEEEVEEEEVEGDDVARKLAEYSYDVDCSVCVEECQKIENMEANGYVDATEFLECAMIYDPDDDSKAALYGGPVCASGGTKIKIGVFSDENCLYLDADKDIDDYLMDQDNVQMKLSHALLKQTYSTCLSCLEPADANENNNGNDAEDGDQVIELCENLYDEAAKCEKTHGFDNGYGDYYGYENQLAQEEVVCDFMQSLKSGTYDEEGEIIISGASSSSGGSSTSTGQKFALSFFVIGTVCLAIYAAMLHSKLVKGAKTEMSSGGAMA